VDDTLRLLSWTSHELRSPLNAILGYGQLLELDDLTDGQRASVAHMKAAGVDLLRILDDVLDFARARAGALPLAPELLSVDAALAEAAETAGWDGAAGRCGASVVADPGRLAQALGILLLQASAFGKVDASCRAEGGRVLIELRADAPGVDAGRLERLFVPFEGQAATIEGGAVRLPLAKLLVEAMGGSVEARLDDGRVLVAVGLPQAP
jgi:signal transduction histidine kinase